MDNDRIEEHLQTIGRRLLDMMKHNENQLSVISDKLEKADYVGLTSMEAVLEEIKWLRPRRENDQMRLLKIARYVGTKGESWGYSLNETFNAVTKSAIEAGFTTDYLWGNVNYYQIRIEEFTHFGDVQNEIIDLNCEDECNKHYLAMLGTYVGRNATEWGHRYGYITERLQDAAYGAGFWHEEVNVMLGNFAQTYVCTNAEKFGIELE